MHMQHVAAINCQHRRAAAVLLQLNCVDSKPGIYWFNTRAMEAWVYAYKKNKNS